MRCCDALQEGKEVALFVELKARFDEARNVELGPATGGGRGASGLRGRGAQEPREGGAGVAEREPDGLRRYVHIGTGNYNAATARVYTDLGLFSADPEIGADVHDLFNQLTGSSHIPGGPFRRLAVAPETLLPWLLDAIDRETAHARAGRTAADPGQAQRPRRRGSDRGAVRGVARRRDDRADRAGTLHPPARGAGALGADPGRQPAGSVSSSTRASTISLNAGADEYYIGSADWRPRNLRRRIEVVAPVTDPSGRDRLGQLLDTELADDLAWELEPDGSYRRRGPPANA